MKVNFEYTKDEYKKYLINSRIWNNIGLFIFGVVLYLILSYNKVSLIYLPLVVVGLIVLIILLNVLYVYLYLKANELMNYNTYGKYTLELTPNKFSITLNKRKTDYKYNQISKIVERKKYFKVKFKKSKEFLTFEKKLFKDKDYNKMITMFKEKI